MTLIGVWRLPEATVFVRFTCKALEYYQVSHVIDYFVSPQDPILGIEAGNLAAELDESNWQRKAVIIPLNQGEVYVHVGRAVTCATRKRHFCVNVYDLHQRNTVLQEPFLSLEAALAFIVELAAVRLVA